MSDKIAYICGPLTELPFEIQKATKDFYSKIADACKEITGKRAFVPHEHYDPIKHANFTPKQVDEAERLQVCEKTSILIVLAIAPSWGGGIEVEMAFRSNVPVLVFYPDGKRVSRLLRGNPAVKASIPYDTEFDLICLLEQELWNFRISSFYCGSYG